ncbi:MAG: cell division protein ZapA [Oscillospiraceae bacterium]|jgi:predicted  nucleic acid-binding Zn-ribbon protein|nr:cell division protein ZapA [Oscillospiraceae bacterium]
MDKQKVRIVVAGLDLTVMTDDPPEVTQELAAAISEEIEQIRRSNPRVSAVQAAVLTCLGCKAQLRQTEIVKKGLRDELGKCLQESYELKKEVELLRHEAERLRKELTQARSGY